MTYNVSADYLTDSSLASVESTDISPLRVVDNDNSVTGKIATVPLRLYRQLLTELELSQAETVRLRELHKTLRVEFEKLWEQHEHIQQLLSDRKSSTSKLADVRDETVGDAIPEKVVLKPAPIKPNWVCVEPAAEPPNLAVTPISGPTKIEAEPGVLDPDLTSVEADRIADNGAGADVLSAVKANRIAAKTEEKRDIDPDVQDELSTPHSALNFLTALRKRDRQKQKTYEPLPLPPTLVRRPTPAIDSGAQANSEVKPEISKKVEIRMRPNSPVSELFSGTITSEPDDATKISPQAGSLNSGATASKDGRRELKSDRAAATIAARPMATPPTSENGAYIRPVSPESLKTESLKTESHKKDSLKSVPPIVRPARRIESERSRGLPSRPEFLRREPEIEDLSQYENVPPAAPPSRESNANLLMGAAGACMLLCVAFGAGFLLVQPVIERIEATPPESAPLTVPEAVPAE